MKRIYPPLNFGLLFFTFPMKSGLDILWLPQSLVDIQYAQVLLKMRDHCVLFILSKWPQFPYFSVNPLLISPLNLLLKQFVLYSLWIIIHTLLHFIIYLLKSIKPLWLLWHFGTSRWHMRVLQLHKAITLKLWGVMWCSTYQQKWKTNVESK